MERVGGGSLPYAAINRFVKSLKKYNLTTQQKRTLRGQALSGDLEAAKRGLSKLIREKGA